MLVVGVAFFLACEDCGEGSMNHSPPALVFKVEIDSRAPILGSVHSGSVS